jgi:hypothetical protein
MAGLAVDEVTTLVEASPPGDRGWKADPKALGLRGGTCPVCCREAADAGQDHWWPAESEALLRVSCPSHQCALVMLEDLVLARTPKGLRLMVADDLPLGAHRRNERLADPVLAMEAAIAACLDGRPPGSAWRLREPAELLRSVDLLIDYVFYAAIGELPFAHAFDLTSNPGGGVFRLSPARARRGVSSLQRQPGRTRRNALAALQSLLATPAHFTGEVVESRGWRAPPDGQGPYRLLAENLDREGRERLGRDLPRLLVGISSAAKAALDEIAARPRRRRKPRGRRPRALAW